MYQCLTSNNIQSCKKTAGYVKINGENSNYYSIPMAYEDSSKIIDTTLRSSCDNIGIGELVRTEDGEKALCTNGNKMIKFSYSEYYNKKYLILDTINSGAFAQIKQNSINESGIVISSIPANNEFPAMITYDVFYSSNFKLKF